MPTSRHGPGTASSRFVRAAKTDARGAFRIVGLPENERYLAAAVDALEEGEASDPDFLGRVRERATPFGLAEAQSRVLDLMVVQR